MTTADRREAAPTLRLRTLLAVACFLSLSALAAAQQPAIEARFIPVPAPTGELVQRVRTVTAQEWEQFRLLQQRQPQERQLKLVFDFNPDDRPNHSDRNSYGVCRDLAECIQELRQNGVETYAFVHGRVSGHSVLPVLACSRIVMSLDARLGPVVEANGPEPKEDVKVAYRQMSAHRPSPVLAEKLVDPRLVVVQSRKGGWVSREAPDANPEVELFRAGAYAEYDFRKARSCDLCEQDAIASRDRLVSLYGWPPSSLQEHALLRDRIVAGHVEVKGPVTMELYEDLQRRVNAAAGDGVNLLVLELRCGGGSTSAGLTIANYLRELNTKNLDTPMLTVAWVTADARDTAIYLALGCNLFLMAPNAHLGDFTDLAQGKSPAELQEAARGLEKLADQQCYPAKLVRGMIDPAIKNLFLVSSNDGRSQGVLTGEELDADRRLEKPRWTVVREIDKGRGGLVLLTATQARELGLSRGEAEDADTVYRKYGVSKAKVRDYGDDWIDDFKRFLSNPWTSFFLVMIGITCLILELKVPGATLPGVIAAVCFVLFFWSQTKVGAPVLWLAVLLFVLGLILLGLEIFVLPGFGVCGISGMILTFGSLGLAAYGRWPQTKTQWLEYGNQVAPYGLALMGAILTAMVLVRYLPSIPILNRLYLTPEPEVADGGALPGAPVYPELTGMLGAIGVSATPLRPAGKVQFGEQFLDVVAEGGYVVPGTRVQVVEIEGNRVVVKEV